MRLLLVDDELLHLEGLYHIIAQHYPSADILCANDGLEALNLLEQYSVNIIFTDIEMPLLSGLELIEQLHEKSIKSKIVIISAHDKFSYAQRALSLGVLGYILKPFTPEQIISTLDQILSLLSQEYDEIQKGAHLQSQLTNTLPVYLEHVLNKLAYSTLDSPELNFLKDIFSFDKPFLIVVTRFDRSINDDIRKDYPLFIRQQLHCYGKGLSFVCQESATDFCTLLQLPSPSCVTERSVVQFLDKLCYNYFHLFFAVSDLIPQFPYDLSTLLHTLTRLCDYHWFLGSKFALGMQERFIPPVMPFSITAEVHEDFMRLVRVNNTEQACRLLEDLFAAPLEQLPTKSAFVAEMTALMSSAFELLLQMSPSKENLQLTTEFSDTLRFCPCLAEARTLCLQTLTELIARRAATSSLSRQDMMDDCIKYLNSAYMEDLSLENVASRYYFNPSYFSTLFRACTNVSFSEYLAQVRLAKSAELLITTNKKVYEIANKVGYSDSGYYNRVFKKQYGVSPEQYRKLHSREAYGL